MLSLHLSMSILRGELVRSSKYMSIQKRKCINVPHKTNHAPIYLQQKKTRTKIEEIADKKIESQERKARRMEKTWESAPFEYPRGLKLFHHARNSFLR